jgi:hypothetical protein
MTPSFVVARTSLVDPALQWVECDPRSFAAPRREWRFDSAAESEFVPNQQGKCLGN